MRPHALPTIVLLSLLAVLKSAIAGPHHPSAPIKTGPEDGSDLASYVTVSFACWHALRPRLISL